MIKLYKRDARGNMMFWQVEAGDEEIVIKWGQEGGEVQRKTEEVEFGRGGRDETEQMELRMESRANKKRDQGYVDSRDHAMKFKAVNALGLPRPMLATPLKKVGDIDMKGVYVQYKYDGHRCLITRRGDELIAYSRNGKPIRSISHILRDIHISKGVVLDGELYHHGTPLQTISSWVRRTQQKSTWLKFICYDIIMQAQFRERLQMLHSINIQRLSDRYHPIKIAPSICGMGFADIPAYLAEVRKEGYEGLILRRPGAGYEDGKRSKSLVKVKAWEDDEFMIIGVATSRDGWARLRCTTKEGNIFSVSAPGTIEEKRAALDKLLVNTFVRIEYACLTKDGVPFHPVATNYVE
jgi:DNA ligase-1